MDHGQLVELIRANIAKEVFLVTAFHPAGRAVRVFSLSEEGGSMGYTLIVQPRGLLGWLLPWFAWGPVRGIGLDEIVELRPLDRSELALRK